MNHLDQIVLILIWCIGLCIVLGVGAALADWIGDRLRRMNAPKPQARRREK